MMIFAYRMITFESSTPRSGGSGGYISCKRDHNRKVVMDQAPLTVIGQKVFNGGYFDQVAIVLLYRRFAKVRFQKLTAWMKLEVYFQTSEDAPPLSELSRYFSLLKIQKISNHVTHCGLPHELQQSFSNRFTLN